jgi:DNA repair exonuclease SbcCD ATPase subunit
MAKVSISEAARLVNLSRSYMYKKYINQGHLSVTTNHQGKPEVDVAELLRVFGAVHQSSTLEETGTQEINTYNKKLTTENQHLKEQLQAVQIRLELMQTQLAQAAEQAEWYKRQIEDLVGTVKLLEYKPEPPPRRWWQWWR